MIEIKNPHKKFLIPRTDGYEEHFYPIIRKITGCSQGKVSGGADYENDTFTIRTYFMGGGCPCKMCEFKRDFEEDNEHAENCFHVEWDRMDKEYKKHPKYSFAPPLKIARLEHEKYMMKEYGIPLRERKSPENICTCHYKAKMQKELGPIGFVEDCYYNLPNFHFKQDDFKIWINQNFFRDSYSNKKISVDEFKTICRTCIMSLPRFNHEPVLVEGEDVGGQF